MKNIRRLFVVLALALAGLAVSPSTPVPVASAGNLVYMPYFHPGAGFGSQFTSGNPTYGQRYLTGYNYLNPAAPSLSNLWIKSYATPNYTDVYLYNAGPGNNNSWHPDPECNRDTLRWYLNTSPDPTRTLTYTETRNRCSLSDPNAPDIASIITYGNGTTDKGIVFLPTHWDDASVCAVDPTPSGNMETQFAYDNLPCSWTRSGVSSAVYKEGTTYDNATVKCTGTNSWIAQIHGYEQVAPGVTGIHWSTIQTTTWTSGSGSSTGCGVGQTTRWREDYWTHPNMPVWGSPGLSWQALKRSKGGNFDVPAARWDIWFDAYIAMPAWQTIPHPFG